jgi:hypothetical protein
MNKILLLMSFIGAGYAVSCEMLPPLLVKSLTDSGKNGAQYVLVVNKYDNQAGYYADVYASNGKELKHANHIKNVDVTKIIGAGNELTESKKASKNLIKLEKPLLNDKEKNVKTTKLKAKKKESKNEEVKKSSTKLTKKNDAATKKDAKKELATAKANYKKSGDALDKAKTKKAKQTAQAARARAGKALIKAENAVK